MNINRRTFLAMGASLPFISLSALASNKLVFGNYDVAYIFGPYTKRVRKKYRNKVVFVRSGFRKTLNGDKEIASGIAPLYEAHHIIDLKNKKVLKSREGETFDEIVNGNSHRDVMFVESALEMFPPVVFIKPSEFNLDMVSIV